MDETCLARKIKWKRYEAQGQLESFGVTWVVDIVVRRRTRDREQDCIHRHVSGNTISPTMTHMYVCFEKEIRFIGSTCGLESPNFLNLFSASTVPFHLDNYIFFPIFYIHELSVFTLG